MVLPNFEASAQHMLELQPSIVFRPRAETQARSTTRLKPKESAYAPQRCTGSRDLTPPPLGHDHSLAQARLKPGNGPWVGRT